MTVQFLPPPYPKFTLTLPSCVGRPALTSCNRLELISGLFVTWKPLSFRLLFKAGTRMWLRCIYRNEDFFSAVACFTKFGLSVDIFWMQPWPTGFSILCVFEFFRVNVSSIGRPHRQSMCSSYSVCSVTAHSLIATENLRDFDFARICECNVQLSCCAGFGPSGIFIYEKRYLCDSFKTRLESIDV